jgi:hypothetical protein
MAATSRTLRIDMVLAEVVPMNLKSSTVIAVLVLSCAAAFGQTVKLGFLDHDKQTQYCDYEQLTVEKGGVLVTGTHFPAASGSQTCFSEPGLTGTITGLMSNFSASSSLLVTGTVATFADDTYDKLGGYMGACGCTYYYVSKLRASTTQEIQNNVYGWAAYDNFGGTASLLNFGFTTALLGNNSENAEATYDPVF